MTTPIEPESLIFDIKLSTVVPASITAEDKAEHRLSAIDLAMKLHYITTVHFFSRDAAEGLSVPDMKVPMFRWLQLYYPLCGRVRRHVDGGRPFVKCNDSGVRIVEAKCAKTVAEWLVGGGDHHGRLVYHQPLVEHELGFTPLVFLQITRFKCGGISLGMRWAHILGDAFSASVCINSWSKLMSNQNLPSAQLTPTTVQPLLATSPTSCHSLKPLDPPLGDNWLTPNNFQLQTHTFHITAEKMSNLLSNNNNKYTPTPFDVISAIVWKSVSKARGNIKIITVCKKSNIVVDYELLGNRHQVIGTVEAPEIGDAGLLHIAKAIGERFVDETSSIEKRVEEGNGIEDFVVYGSNLTFFDFEDVDLWGLEINGQAPVFADVSVGGVGDGGAVVVVESGSGKNVNVILRGDELEHVKNEMRVEYGII